MTHEPREKLPYNTDIMAGRPQIKEAPLFGQRLAAVRRNKGLTQVQLAARMQTTQKMIDYYERRSPNPALDFIERAAAALEVSVAELLGSQPHTSRSKPGPASQLERRFERVKLLPRKEQEFVLKFLDTVLEKAQAA
jgi:transcriptional regulator with XRE-family HTH domain